MHAIGQQPQRTPDGAPVHNQRHHPEQTTLYGLVQQHAATFFTQAESAAGADLPQFVKDEFDAFLQCGILAHGFLRLRCGVCGHDKQLTLVLQVVHRVITRHLLGQAGLKAGKADSGAVTLIQRFGSVANLNIHLHRLVLDGVYRCGADGALVFVEVPAPTNEALQVVLR